MTITVPERGDRYAHGAVGIGDDAQRRCVIGDADQAQIVDRRGGGKPRCLLRQLADRGGQPLPGVGGERFQIDHRLVGQRRSGPKGGTGAAPR
jgi:hypothetical protein